MGMNMMFFGCLCVVISFCFTRAALVLPFEARCLERFRKQLIVKKKKKKKSEEHQSETQ